MSNAKPRRRRSIGERLSHAGSLDVQREIALDWAANWRRDHDETLRRLEAALSVGDIDMAGKWCGQLKTLSGKGFVGLGRVIDALADDGEA